MTMVDQRDTRKAQREAVLISGMLRSGAAAASRAVSFLGYSQPRLLAQPGPANPKGAWESTRIVELNEEMIASLGWSWDHTPLLTRPTLSPAEAETEIVAHLAAEWLDRARDAIRSSFREDARRVVCKDPRMSLFPAFWQAAFEAEGYRVQHLLAFRRPLEVASSVQRQQGLGRAPALRAWLAYNLRPLTQVNVAATLDFADLIAQPTQTVNAIARLLGVGALDPAAAVELEEFIDRAHPSPPADHDGRGGPLPELVRRTYKLLGAWRSGPSPRLEHRAENLRQALTEAQLLFGRVRRLPPLVTSSPVYALGAAPTVRPDAAPTSAPKRPLVVHYHLFKNAGSSVDVVLEGNFGADWREVDFAAAGQDADRAEVEEWIARHPDVKALSSRDLIGPTPQVTGVSIAPVLFVRHPIDRIRSAFEFERRRRGHGGAKFATRFDRYIEAELASGSPQVHNFQTRLLATFAAGSSEIDRARRAVAELPFVGLVEDFAGSMTRLETYLRRDFPAFRAFGAKANVWREGRTLEERLGDVRAELGPVLWDRLLAANQNDLAIFEAVSERNGLTIDALLPG